MDLSHVLFWVGLPTLMLAYILLGRYKIRGQMRNQDTVPIVEDHPELNEHPWVDETACCCC